MAGFINFLLDIVFPGSCIACGTGLAPPEGDSGPAATGRWPREASAFFEIDFSMPLLAGVSVPARILCRRCWLKLEPASGRAFVSSGTVDSTPQRVYGANSAKPEEGAQRRVPVVSPFITNDTLLEVIRYMKFSGGRTAVRPISWWMGVSLSKHLEALRSSSRPIVVPVPLHSSRERSRGYNQAGLLAEHTAARLGLELRQRALKRVKKTRPQARLEPEKRAMNVSGAFELAQPGQVKGRDVILVDDLVTTGETVRACMAVLVDAVPSSLTILCAGRAGNRVF